jgi:hypothetical protein
MKLSERVKVSPEVIARQVGEENVMLDLAKGAYYGLDPVGARIWQLLEEGKALEEVCDAIMVEYEVSREDIERDLLALVDNLVANGLVVPA